MEANFLVWEAVSHKLFGTIDQDLRVYGNLLVGTATFNCGCKLKGSVDHPHVAQLTYNGDRATYFDCKVQSLDDQPAIVRANGNQHWYQCGQRHRDNDLPAIVWANGDQYWYQRGELHRDNDLPAIVYANGNQGWYQHGQLRRDNDLPAVVLSNGGDQYWY